MKRNDYVIQQRERERDFWVVMVEVAGEMKTYLKGRHCSRTVSGSIDLQMGSMPSSEHLPMLVPSCRKKKKLLLCIPVHPELGLQHMTASCKQERQKDGRLK